MGIVEILVLGVALSADAFAVTISNTFVYPGETKTRLALMPVLFGLFQGLMPLLGYFVGGLAAEVIEEYSGIITLISLASSGAIWFARACAPCWALAITRTSLAMAPR